MLNAPPHERSRRGLHIGAAALASIALLIAATAMDAATSSDARLGGLRLAGDACAGATLGTDGTLAISWETTEDADASHVMIGRDATYGEVFAAEGDTRAHAVRIPGLTLGSTYHFRVQSRQSTTDATVQSGDCTVTMPGEDRTPPIATSVDTSAFGATSAQLTVVTNEPTRALVTVYEHAGSVTPRAVVDATATLQDHRTFTLNDLAPGMRYTARLDLLDAAGNPTTVEHDFTTELP